jgi:carbon starvation protein
MNAMPLIVVALCIFILAYRYYYAFIVAKIAFLDDKRTTPAHRLEDGKDYVPMNKWVLFGHHFAAIAGAGPLVGPVLAAQFGYLPNFVWMVVGAVVAGSVHDFVIFLASVRQDGKSLAEIAKKEIGKVSGITASIATIIIVIVALAGLGVVVVNALAESSWGTFTIAATIPIGMFMGLWMFKIRPGHTKEATIVGVILLTLCVIFGKYIPDSTLAPFFTLDHKFLTVSLAIYAFVASVLPVWLLLSPRDYLSSIMKIVVCIFLALGVIIVAPDLKMPAFTEFTAGGGPIIPGTIFPYLFITIACGAISGFHACVSSGTSPKLLNKESEIKMITMGSMLAEGMISILALIAACSLNPLDYFQINVHPDRFALIQNQLYAMGFTETNLTQLSKEVGEQLAGRSGGGVSLAVGMAQIFSSIPGFSGLMSYWYHFVIMFEALFILTTLDAGTRIARFILQDALGHIYKPLGRTDWLPSTLLTSGIIVLAWGFFIYTGNVSTIWPMFGVANQLLATFALVVATTWIINRGRYKYMWITVIPMLFLGITTITAGILNIKNIYLPMMNTNGKFTIGLINLGLTSVIILAVVIIFVDALPKWYSSIKSKVFKYENELVIKEVN